MKQEEKKEGGEEEEEEKVDRVRGGLADQSGRTDGGDGGRE